MKYFVASTPARTAADLVGIHRNSGIRFFHKLRGEIARKQQKRAAQFCGEVEVDESYFGGHRTGKRGRGAAGKVIVFGLLKRGGKVYTVAIANVRRTTSLPLIRQKIQPGSVVYTDGHTAYNALGVPNSRISELTTARNSYAIATILTALKPFGRKRNDICENIMVSQNRTLNYS